MSVALATLDDLLGAADRRIALIDRCRSPALAAERERLVAAWLRGARAPAELTFEREPALAVLAGELHALADALAGAGPWGELYAARAAELALEAAIAAQPGDPLARAAAARRFPLPAEPLGAHAERLAELWAAAGAGESTEPLEPGDEEPSPTRLVNALRSEIARHGVPARVEVTPDLASTVAVGESVVRVRAGARLGSAAVVRLVAHEIEGHLLPRWRARGEPLGLFRVGTAGGADDEEGRAVALEAATRGFDARRRGELGWRHLGALALRRGASFVDLVDLLRDRGASVDAAVELALRIDRGTGLGREIVYLPAYLRFVAARCHGPDPEPWLARGRVAVALVPRLARLGVPPEGVELAARVGDEWASGSELLTPLP
jgi:hypothetical protein